MKIFSLLKQASGYVSDGKFLGTYNVTIDEVPKRHQSLATRQATTEAGTQH